ncbi:hypothetical protein ASE00_01375 [Sphingomonas sp. Root710]|uniref:hypothetical protein n=1 Tax=Sphingomonas sp. Root710 TaxID=1736594 RepID=UPI0006F2F109|nr:hypothetical protein [Sphingomonas sp. Root710]KRB85476.1 hypothetical protein ASE00_01375 [Sphingomonas sp. Root710]
MDRQAARGDLPCSNAKPMIANGAISMTTAIVRNSAAARRDAEANGTPPATNASTKIGAIVPIDAPDWKA